MKITKVTEHMPPGAAIITRILFVDTVCSSSNKQTAQRSGAICTAAGRYSQVVCRPLGPLATVRVRRRPPATLPDRREPSCARE